MNKKLIRLTESDLHQVISESVKQILKEGFGLDTPIKKWNYWCTNFYPDFIEEAWADEPILAKHLRGKFEAAYKDVGNYGAMTWFYLNLDNDNQKKLEDYVLNNYQG